MYDRRVVQVTTVGAAVPILASLDIAETVKFYTEGLGFTCRFQSPGEYAIFQRDAIEIHFWPCSDSNIAANTACRVRTSGIEALYNEYSPKGVLRSDCRIEETLHVLTKSPAP
jgi:hypothetical protein